MSVLKTVRYYNKRLFAALVRKGKNVVKACIGMRRPKSDYSLGIRAGGNLFYFYRGCFFYGNSGFFCQRIKFTETRTALCDKNTVNFSSGFKRLNNRVSSRNFIFIRFVFAKRLFFFVYTHCCSPFIRVEILTTVSIQ